MLHKIDGSSLDLDERICLHTQNYMCVIALLNDQSNATTLINMQSFFSNRQFRSS